MRALLLIAGAALALVGCGRNAQNDNNQAAGDNLTAESIVSNDVTAIDAVTGDAANMAADVDMNFGNLNEVGANMPAGQPQRPASEPQRPARPSPRPSAPAETNTAANTTAAAATNGQ
jgi:hypothetical protein